MPYGVSDLSSLPPLWGSQLRAGGAPSGGFPMESLPQTPSLPTPENREKQNLHTFHTKTWFLTPNIDITTVPQPRASANDRPFGVPIFAGNDPKLPQAL